MKNVKYWEHVRGDTKIEPTLLYRTLGVNTDAHTDEYTGTYISSVITPEGRQGVWE